ncbi:MAG: hypothetical protein R3B70_20275 [Polyangiaceae bacterium]
MKRPSSDKPTPDALTAGGESARDKEPVLQDKEPALQDRDPALQDKEPALQDRDPALQDKEPALRGREPARPRGDRGVSPSAKEARGPLVELGIGAGWLVGLSAVAQIVAALFRSNPLAIVVLQAVIVDLAVGRAGVRWDPEASEPAPAGGAKTPRAKTARPRADVAHDPVASGDVDAQKACAREDSRRAVRGVLMGASAALAVTVLAVVVSTVAGWAKVSAHAPGASLVLGLVRAAAIGVRDALLYAGLPLYFVSRARVVPRVAVVIFGGLAAGAAVALHPAATPANVLLAVSVALAAAALWARDGAGCSAAGVAGGWAFFGGTVTRGGLLDIDWQSGSLAPGVVADGAPAWIAAACFLAFAGFALRRPAAS